MIGALRMIEQLLESVQCQPIGSLLQQRSEAISTSAMLQFLITKTHLPILSHLARRVAYFAKVEHVLLWRTAAVLALEAQTDLDRQQNCN
jgi:hypothetical protein